MCTLLPGHFTQKVAEGMAACYTDRESTARAKTHHAHKVLKISTFLPNYKRFFLYGQHLSIDLISGRVKLLLTPAMAC